MRAGLTGDKTGMGKKGGGKAFQNFAAAAGGGGGVGKKGGARVKQNDVECFGNEVGATGAQQPDFDFAGNLAKFDKTARCSRFRLQCLHSRIEECCMLLGFYDGAVVETWAYM
jgi:hypothetical protein